MNNKDKGLVIVFGALAVAGVLWAISASQQKKNALLQLKQKEYDNQVLKTNYLNLLQEYLKNQKTLPNSIKEQLIYLRKQYVGIQDDVANELKGIVELVDSGKEELAIANLTKIIENILKEKYVEEHIVQSEDDCPALHKMIEKAKSLDWITERAFHFSMALKDERNMAFHEINPTVSKNEKIILFLAGIELIYNLKGFKRQTLS